MGLPDEKGLKPRKDGREMKKEINLNNRKLNYYYRTTSARMVVNHFGKKDIVTLWEGFRGTEADAAKANKGLRYRFAKCEPGKDVRKQLDEAYRAGRKDGKIVIYWEAENEYYRFKDEGCRIIDKK